MSLAQDMLNLRHEIDGLHAARREMMNRLERFRTDLRRSMAHSVGEMRRAFMRDCAEARAVRRAFIAHNHEVVGAMLGAFGTERAAARRNFRSGRA